MSFFTTGEAAEMLGVNLTTIQNWCDTGVLGGVAEPGKHRRIPAGDVELMSAAKALVTRLFTVDPDRSLAPFIAATTVFLKSKPDVLTTGKYVGDIGELMRFLQGASYGRFGSIDIKEK